MEGSVEEGSGEFKGTQIYIYIVILGLKEIGCPFRYIFVLQSHIVKDWRNDKTFAATWHFHNYQCSVVRS